MIILELFPLDLVELPIIYCASPVIIDPSFCLELLLALEHCIVYNILFIKSQNDTA